MVCILEWRCFLMNLNKVILKNGTLYLNEKFNKQDILIDEKTHHHNNNH